MRVGHLSHDSRVQTSRGETRLVVRRTGMVQLFLDTSILFCAIVAADLSFLFKERMLSFCSACRQTVDENYEPQEGDALFNDEDSAGMYALDNMYQYIYGSC